MRFITRLLATARELWPYYLAITVCTVLVAVAGLVSELTSLGLLKPAPRTGSGEDEATR